MLKILKGPNSDRETHDIMKTKTKFIEPLSMTDYRNLYRKKPLDSNKNGQDRPLHNWHFRHTGAQKPILETHISIFTLWVIMYLHLHLSFFSLFLSSLSPLPCLSLCQFSLCRFLPLFDFILFLFLFLFSVFNMFIFFLSNMFLYVFYVICLSSFCL